MDKCFICNGQFLFFIKTRNFEILKCQKCGLGKTKNLKANLGDYHRDNTYLQEENLFTNIFQKRVNLINKFIGRRKVLEVGCSTGLMLELFKKKGFLVKGIEISQKAAEKAKQRGIDVILKPFEKVYFKDKFDAVVFNHTLEHLQRPDKVIKQAAGIVNNGGIIYIDLPNFGSLSAKIFKAGWLPLLPREHLWHFTRKSLEILLNRNGFKVVFVECASGVWDVNNPYLELWKSFTSFRRRFFMNIISFLPGLFLTKLKIGSDLMVIAKKAYV